MRSAWGMGGTGVSVLRREASVRMEENLWEVGVRVRSESVITLMNSFFGTEEGCAEGMS